MTVEIDLATWSRAEQFRFFRTYERPHYALTARADMTAVMRARPAASPFLAAIHAIGAGIHAVPEMRTRFRDERVVRHAAVTLSPTIPMESGAFRYAYLDWRAEYGAFAAAAAPRVKAARDGALNANAGERDDLAYLSCLPWVDFTALDNALPGPADCIPRISWGRIVPRGKGHDMAVAVQVHHALVDGRHVALFLDAMQSALDAH
ncbi:MAG: CatA-like O-acetyltransferase [Hasllibacter sp.]